MYEAKVWMLNFLARYGMIFIGLYLGTFFLMITMQRSIGFEAFPGDLFLETEKLGGLVLYLPFISALASAVFFTIIFEIYKNLKG